MLLFILSYLGGVLTMLSPCILPVLPFVFTRAGQPFLRSGLPMLVGMATSFAMVASLATVAGAWVVAANHYGRLVAMGLLAVFGVLLLWPGLAAWLAAPVSALGGRLSAANNKSSGVGSSALLGLATGLLWAPCAGPVLGLILTGAALNGPNASTSLLLLAYAAGAATALTLALYVGGKVFALMKRSLGLGEWLRRGMGALVLMAVGAIALGLDTGLLTQLSLTSTNAIEQRLIDGLSSAASEAPPAPAVVMASSPALMRRAAPVKTVADPAPAAQPEPLAAELAPTLDGATQWLNSAPLSLAGLRGKVVLVDFWTYSCAKCLRALPHVRAWAEKYKDRGLVVVGVHSPEFAYERNLDNVKRAVANQAITYPVAVDNAYTLWRAFQNRYWPAHYLIDAEGRIRHRQFGEGQYDQSERIIQQLLREAELSAITDGVAAVRAGGGKAASRIRSIPEPLLDQTAAAGEQVAVFAGCNFWSVQGVFQHVRGVTRAVAGYAGGSAANASYSAVITGTTGHAEAVHLTYDPDAISYGELLRIYFSVAHDPTQLDRQGPDRGPHYRSAIFPQNEEQAQVARAYIKQLNAAHIYPVAIVTNIEPGKPFFPAEEEHQNYMAHHPSEPYIVSNALPKVERLRALFPERFRAAPRLMAQAES